jgi:hypothetical protein
MLQRFGATSGCAVQVELHESTFRLPASVEMGLARLAHELMLDARSGGAREVRLVLRTDPPSGSLVVEHDGKSTWDPSRPVPALLGKDASVQVEPAPDGAGIRLVMNVGRQAGAGTAQHRDTNDTRRRVRREV